MLRLAFDERQDLFQIVHINEPSPIESTAYLIKYDSVHGEKQPCVALGTCMHAYAAPPLPPMV